MAKPWRRLFPVHWPSRSASPPSRAITFAAAGESRPAGWLIQEAYTSRAWAVLGYDSWDAYCNTEFGSARLRLPREERQEVVASLRESGLSVRAIATATGTSIGTVVTELGRCSELNTSHMTVDRDLTEPSVTNVPVERGVTVLSLDGRERPAARPADPYTWVEPDESAIPGQSHVLEHTALETVTPTVARRRPLPEAFADAGRDLTRAAEVLPSHQTCGQCASAAGGPGSPEPGPVGTGPSHTCTWTLSSSSPWLCSRVWANSSSATSWALPACSRGVPVRGLPTVCCLPLMVVVTEVRYSGIAGSVQFAPLSTLELFDVSRTVPADALPRVGGCHPGRPRTPRLTYSTNHLITVSSRFCQASPVPRPQRIPSARGRLRMDRPRIRRSSWRQLDLGHQADEHCTLRTCHRGARDGHR